MAGAATSPVAALPAAQRVFDALLARLEARKDFPKIGRSYLTVGDIDFPTRCSQFAVSARAINPLLSAESVPGIPGAIRPHAAYKGYSLEVGVAYTDCWPVDVEVIKPTRETKAAQDLLARCDVVIAELFAAYYAHELVDDCLTLSVGPVIMVGPEGGVSGITVLLTVQLV